MHSLPTGHGQVVDVVAGPVGGGPRLTVAGEPGVDKPRVLFHQRLRAQTQPLHHTWPHAAGHAGRQRDVIHGRGAGEYLYDKMKHDKIIISY